MSDTPRSVRVERRTKETSITLVLTIEGTGEAKVRTGIGFFDHMLGALAKHGSFDLELTCDGDLHIDQHHTVEDSAIVLGQAFAQALGDKSGLARCGHAYFPLDEALARAVVDLSGRPYLVWNVDPSVQGPNSPMDVSMIEGFFKALSDHARCALHVDLLRGRDFHHSTEAVFKAVARALRDACARDPRVKGVPSTKGVL
jgi:imidazoleglycerol-phosphate dehydratase